MRSGHFRSGLCVISRGPKRSFTPKAEQKQDKRQRSRSMQLAPSSAYRRAHRPRTEGFVTDNAQLIQEIKEVIASEGMVDISKITPDATIESLDLKSVDIVMILTALEEKFNVYIPMDGSLQEAKDVKSLIEALADQIQKERGKQ